MAGSSQDPTAPHRRRRRAARRAAGPPAQASTAPIADPAADQESPTDPASVRSSGPGDCNSRARRGFNIDRPRGVDRRSGGGTVRRSHSPPRCGRHRGRGAWFAGICSGWARSQSCRLPRRRSGAFGGPAPRTGRPVRLGIRRRAPSIRSVLPGRVGRAIAALTGDHPLEPGVPHRCAPGQRSSPAFRRRSGRRRAGPGDRPAALRPADGPVHRTPPGLAQQARFDRGLRWFG